MLCMNCLLCKHCGICDALNRTGYALVGGHGDPPLRIDYERTVRRGGFPRPPAYLIVTKSHLNVPKEQFMMLRINSCV